MPQKYPQPWKSRRSKLPQCCLSRSGLVKKRWDEKPTGSEVPQGQVPYPCKRNGGWHLKAIRPGKPL